SVPTSGFLIDHLTFSFSPFPNPQVTRFSRGEPGWIALESFVLPSDLETGVRLNLVGDDQYCYPVRPWFHRIARTSLQHPKPVAFSGGSYTLSSFAVENPIIAFGKEAGGSKLYTGHDYKFGVFAGFNDEGFAETNLIRISA